MKMRAMNQRTSVIVATVVVVAVLAIIIIPLAVCLGRNGSAGGGITPKGEMAAVTADSVVFTESEAGVVMSWDAVEDATSYTVAMHGHVLETRITVVNFSKAENGFSLPSDGKFVVAITAKSYDYGDSTPTTITYTVEGVELSSPTITKFENEVLEWQPSAATSAITVTITDDAGKPVQVSANGMLGLKSYTGARTVTLTATGDGLYFKNSNVVKLRVNAAHTAVSLLPITEYTVENGRLSWTAAGGASEYVVEDIKRNRIHVTDNHYDIASALGDRNIVTGVYPVSDSAIVGDAPITAVDIDYLEGEGTEQNPYLIKTPFDLRAIDYYELRYAEKLKTSASTPRNYYRLENDLDYSAITPDDSGISNIYTLTQPFYGTLDGNNKKLSDIFVAYDGGHWALFDYITPTGTVKDITFEKPIIMNVLQKPTFPLKATIAAIAYENYGTVSGITITGAKFAASGGEVCGIVTHNQVGGVVQNCTVSSSTFLQQATGQESQACYEMAGVVLENYGRVMNNVVNNLVISGSEATGAGNSKYNIVRTSGGIVAVNRSGGEVMNNSYNGLSMLNMLNDYVNYEFGGLVAYNAAGGTVVVGAASNIGSFRCGASSITVLIGNSIGLSGIDYRGTHVGKNDGTVI